MLLALLVYFCIFLCLISSNYFLPRESSDQKEGSQGDEDKGEDNKEPSDQKEGSQGGDEDKGEDNKEPSDQKEGSQGGDEDKGEDNKDDNKNEEKGSKMTLRFLQVDESESRRAVNQAFVINRNFERSLMIERNKAKDLMIEKKGEGFDKIFQKRITAVKQKEPVIISVQKYASSTNEDISSRTIDPPSTKTQGSTLSSYRKRRRRANLLKSQTLKPSTSTETERLLESTDSRRMSSDLISQSLSSSRYKGKRLPKSKMQGYNVGKRSSSKSLHKYRKSSSMKSHENLLPEKNCQCQKLLSRSEKTSKDKSSKEKIERHKKEKLLKKNKNNELTYSSSVLPASDISSSKTTNLIVSVCSKVSSGEGRKVSFALQNSQRSDVTSETQSTGDQRVFESIKTDSIPGKEKNIFEEFTSSIISSYLYPDNHEHNLYKNSKENLNATLPMGIYSETSSKITDKLLSHEISISSEDHNTPIIEDKINDNLFPHLSEKKNLFQQMNDSSFSQNLSKNEIKLEMNKETSESAENVKSSLGTTTFSDHSKFLSSDRLIQDKSSGISTKQKSISRKVSSYRTDVSTFDSHRNNSDKQTLFDREHEKILRRIKTPLKSDTSSKMNKDDVEEKKSFSNIKPISAQTSETRSFSHEKKSYLKSTPKNIKAVKSESSRSNSFSKFHTSGLVDIKKTGSASTERNRSRWLEELRRIKQSDAGEEARGDVLSFDKESNSKLGEEKSRTSSSFTSRGQEVNLVWQMQYLSCPLFSSSIHSLDNHYEIEDEIAVVSESELEFLVERVRPELSVQEEFGENILCGYSYHHQRARRAGRRRHRSSSYNENEPEFFMYLSDSSELTEEQRALRRAKAKVDLLQKSNDSQSGEDSTSSFPKIAKS